MQFWFWGMKESVDGFILRNICNEYNFVLISTWSWLYPSLESYFLHDYCISLIIKHRTFYGISCQVPATYTKEIYKANSHQTQKLQHYQRNLTNMNAATHKYQRIKPQHLSNFINCSPKKERALLQIEFATTRCLFRKNSKLLKKKKTKYNLVFLLMSKSDYKQLRIDRKYLIPYIQNLEKK